MAKKRLSLSRGKFFTLLKEKTLLKLPDIVHKNYAIVSIS